jgi:membrane protein DedA with SNARE-associated domain
MNTSHLISSYGYWAIFAFIAAESLGIPIPGETALIAAGAYAGHTHLLNPWAIFAVAAASAVAGNIAGYLIGAKGGFALARRYGSKVRLDEHKLKVGRYVLDRQGGKVVFFGRFISVLRTYVSFLAGTVHMGWKRFALASTAGGVVWAGIYTTLSYNAAKTLEKLSGTIDLIIAAVAVVVVGALVVLVNKQIKALGDKAEGAYPGPLE